MSYKPSFFSVDSFTEKSLLTNLEHNMKAFLNWGLLNVGAYVNVDIPTVNIHNFSQHILKPTKDQNRPERTVWQSPRKDWVHEYGICFKDTEPNTFSGVFVSGLFYPAPTGNSTIGYTVDYPNGQIIFNQALPTNTSVQASYSYKQVQIYNSNEFPGWKEIQLGANKNTANQFNSYNSGDFAVAAEHRVQLPAIVVEADARESSSPFRLGDHSLILKQDILCHIISENKTERYKIVDAIRYQKDRHIWLYDINKIVQDKVYELNLNGSINPNRINYEDLLNLNQYRWHLARISDIQVSDMVFYHMNLYGSTVRVTLEFIHHPFTNTCIVGGENTSSSDSSASSGSSNGDISSGSSHSSTSSGSSGSSDSSAFSNSSSNSSASSDSSGSSESNGSSGSSASSGSSDSSGSSSESSSTSDSSSSSDVEPYFIVDQNNNILTTESGDLLVYYTE
jgi:hypothetical protein